MNILNEPISSFSFRDIVSFCDEGHVEGTQLDYKKIVPKNLAKHFAAFSNTRGGVIIIGVEEDDKNGKPKKYEGVKDDGKVIDQIHQFAANVSPRPRYEIHRAEDQKSGKMFVLVRIYEGDNTPYYVQNDSHVYIRTGNISDPIENAKPEMLELLFNKRQQAEKTRNFWLERSGETFQAIVRKANRDREEQIRREHPDDFKEKIKELPPIGIGQPAFHFFIQPYFPNEPIIEPMAMKERVLEYRQTSRYLGDFPDLNLEPFQDGVFSVDWEQGGLIDFDQLYSPGLIRRDRTLYIDKNTAFLQHIVVWMHVTLSAARNFYKLFGYQGVLVGEISVSNIEGVNIQKIIPNGWRDLFDRKAVGLLNEYSWPIEIETSELFDPKNFQSFIVGKIKEFYWSFGLEHPTDKLVKALFKDMGWNWAE